uniref:Uncharacterized protein n=1 Tax=Pelusios castaneus TaxID=367368 RepID=A0A8C8S0C0_9SAUR
RTNRQSLCKVSAFLKESETKNFFSLSLVFPAQAAMAATNPAKTLQDETSCPICLEYFKDPVVLDCDHNFCRACITQCWEGSQTLSCPQCRQTCPEKNLRPNRQLRTIVEAARGLRPRSKKRQDNPRVEGETEAQNTAHPQLVLSEDGKRVRWGHTRQDLPNNPERFDTALCVLGREGFTSGRHCWEVEVGGWQCWGLGVARESVQRKREISYSPEEGIWAVWRWGDQFWALTSPKTLLPQSRVPSRIRVCLDCDWGQVTFFRAGDEAPIFTFLPGSVPGERIRPWLWVWDTNTGLRLCP